MAYDRELAARIRQALEARVAFQEKPMFGGLSFLVNGKIALVADHQGRLMVRCIPARTDTLLAETTAQRAVMKGRPMSKGWLVVPADADINFWVGVAVP